jgi:hypothetical protein
MGWLPVGQPGFPAQGTWSIDASLDMGPIMGLVTQSTDINIAEKE